MRVVRWGMGVEGWWRVVAGWLGGVVRNGGSVSHSV